MTKQQTDLQFLREVTATAGQLAKWLEMGGREAAENRPRLKPLITTLKTEAKKRPQIAGELLDIVHDLEIELS